MPASQLCSDAEVLENIAALPLENAPLKSFLETVALTAQSAEKVIEALRLNVHAYERPKLEDLIPDEYRGVASAGLLDGILREYFTKVDLAAGLGLKNRAKPAGMKADDFLWQNASQASGDPVLWRRNVHTYLRAYIDKAVSRAEADIKEYAQWRLSSISERLKAEGFDNLPKLQLDGVLAAECSRWQSQLYAASGTPQDNPELLYKLSFQECAKAKGWDKLNGEELAAKLQEEQVALDIFEKYTERKITFPKKKPGRVAEVIEREKQKAKRGFLSRLFRREDTTAPLENLEGNLKDAYALAEPGTVLHVDELMNERRTNAALRSVPFYTADGNLYFVRDGKPFWAITREPENLVLRHIDEAYPLLTQNIQYYPGPEEAAEAIAADDTVLIDVSQLLLAGSDNEWRYLVISTSPNGYNQLNAEGRKAAERVFGSGNDFVQNMQMLCDARINDTKIYLLNPAYVAQHASQRVLGRGSWLNLFNDGSDFGGGGRGINNLARLRGVRRSRR